jgi:pilus assembly protein CpaF
VTVPDDGAHESIRDRFAIQFPGDSLARLRPQPRRAPAEGLVPRAPTPGVRRSHADYPTIKADLQARVLNELTARRMLEAEEQELGAFVRSFVDRVLAEEELPLNQGERARLADELTAETLGVGPLAPLLADPAVADVLVNGPEQVYVERYGRLEPTSVRFRDAEHVLRVIERIAARVGRRIDVASPMVDLRLPDGSRVNATIPPASPDGPTISIRRFGQRRLRREDLLRLEMWSEDLVAFLDLAVRARKNILISGGTGAGKSTLLGALCEAIPGEERIITIEDTMELLLDQKHVLRLEARPPNADGRGEITQLALMTNTLRMRPDRIIVGEVRGGEALVMLQAMNTGHDGGMSTIHANSPRDALSRLETMVLMAGVDLPMSAIRQQIASAIQLLVHVRRYEDGVRRIESVAEITGLEATTFSTQELFRFVRRGRDGRKLAGAYEPTGIVPRFADDLRARGLPLPPRLFRTTRD